MQLVSQAYKTEMLQLIRDESYVWVYLGVINREAQASAMIEQDLYEFASKDIFTDSRWESYYATFEENQCKVDGSMTLAPEVFTVNPLFQGAVTEGLLGSITFTFDGYSHLSWRGLTIDFSDYYPTVFTVSDGHETYRHENNAAHCVIEDVFRDTDHITITPIEMVGGNQRMRIMSISFGVGLVFDNSNLISTSRKNVVDHLSSKLPSKNFTFTVDNRSHRFHVDDPNSYINFLEQEQNVEYEYGRKIVAEDGTSSIYKIEGGNVLLKTWSSNQTTAKFTAVGNMDYLDGEYYKGRYHPEGITAYAAVMDILADAGIENYRIDEYLKKVIIHNPVPKDTYKNCLQLIANLCRSVLYEDRQGRLVIDSSFMPDIVSVTVTDEAPWSNHMKVISDDDLINYATFEQDYTTVDDTMYLLPDGLVSHQDNTGYVSGYVFRATNDNLTRRIGGRFGQEAFPFRSSDAFDTVGLPNVSITVEWESQWTFYQTEFEFGGTYPTKVRLHLFRGDEEVSVKDHVVTGLKFVVEDAFYEINKMVIDFPETKPNQRVHIQKLNFTRLSDYELRFADMDTKPTVTSVEKIKTINVHYFQYSNGTEEEKVGTTFLHQGDNLLTYDDPHYDWRAEFTHKEEEDPETGEKTDVTPTGDLSIVESGAYYVIVNSSIDADVDINGYLYTVSDNTYLYPNYEIGAVKTSGNDLIDNAEEALRQAEWLAEYFSSDAQFAITYRGEPRIDCDDLIYLQSDFTDNTMIRVEEEQLDTATGMSMKCKIKGRRTTYTRRR